MENQSYTSLIEILVLSPSPLREKAESEITLYLQSTAIIMIIIIIMIMIIETGEIMTRSLRVYGLYLKMNPTTQMEKIS